MAERREDTFIDTLKSKVFTAVYENDKVTLYTVDSRVIKVHFHETYHWKYLTSWNCTPCPDKCYLHLSNTELSRQLRALKDEVDTGDRHLMNIDGPLVFKFVHDTDDDVRQMVAQNKTIGNTFKQFLQKIDSQVKYITMEATVDGTTGAVSQAASLPVSQAASLPVSQAASLPVSQAASLPVSQDTVTTINTGMSDSSTAIDSNVAGQVNARDVHQGHTTNYAFSLLSFVFVTNDSSGNSVFHTRWATIHKTGKHTLQPTISDFRRLWTQTKELFHASLEACWSGSMVFCFEHESREDAITMIIRHTEVKEVILHFLQELDPSIQDIRMEVELRDVSESEEQTSETRPRGMPDPEHKDEEGASRSHPQQKDDDKTSHPHIQESGDNSSSLSHSPQTKDENTCLPYPQKTEEDKTSLQQTDEDTSHLHPQKTEGDKTSLQQTDEDTSHLHPQKTEEDKTSLQQTDEDTSHLHPQKTEGDKTSLQQTDEDTSHLHPQQVYVKDKIKYQTSGLEKGLGSHSSGYTSSDPSLKPLVKGQDSDRRASSDPSQGHSQSEEDPRLSTASHASSDPSRRRWYPLLSTASHATPSQADGHLFFASRVRDLEEVKRLLSTPGVDVDCRVGRRSPTPVMWAAYKGHRDVVELLVSEGADVSLVDKYGDNTLHYACMGGDVETVKYVLSLNVVYIDARNKLGQTAADVARSEGRQQVVDLFVSRGAQ